MGHYSGLLSFGNSKLPQTTAIFNMGSASECSSRQLGLCQLAKPSDCYALQAEKQYPSVLPYRNRQSAFWQYTSATDIAAQFRLWFKSRKVKAIRFNESGDLWTIADLVKLAAIAKAFPTLAVYTYTARRDIWEAYSASGMELPSNLTVNGSGFVAHNEFRAVAKVDKKSLHCKGNCRHCSLCQRRLGKSIFVELH